MIEQKALQTAHVYITVMTRILTKNEALQT